MNNRQKIAYNNPCHFGSDSLRPIYHQDIFIGKNKVSTILTVDAFGGGFIWHVSASILSNKTNKPIVPFGRISNEEGRQILKFLNSLLEGVGDGDIRATHTITCFHFYRRLSQNEIWNLEYKAV